MCGNKSETLNKYFNSNGKLLITSEYLVLDGAEALAIPTVYGQSLEVKSISENVLKWKSFDHEGRIWFESVFQKNGTLELLSFSEKKLSETLFEILLEAQKLNPHFLSEKSGLEVITKLNFPRDWGLGSSSTLINNIAQWANVNAFDLLKNSFGGSGYDIACAQNDLPVLFSNKDALPIVKNVRLNWGFIDELFFVHLNKKQDSKQSIIHYNQLKTEKQFYLNKINEITRHLLNAESLEVFENLIEHHENLLSELLKLPKIKDRLFADYSGSIKSLGGWGGDFILVSRKVAPEYFRSKGFTTVIPFRKMIK